MNPEQWLSLKWNGGSTMSDRWLNQSKIIQAFVKLHDFLVSGEDLGREFTMGMGGFILKNTLSDNGAVTRGVSVVDENCLLSQVHETTGIEMGEDGQIKCDSEEVQEWISPEDKVSMNMWAGYPEFLDFLAEDFKDFLANVEEGDLKSEREGVGDIGSLVWSYI